MKVACVVLALVAVASAGAPFAYAPAVVDHHIGAQSEQTVRGFGGLSSVSHQARQVNGAFSTSSAYKTKATNSLYAAAPVAAYASPLQYAAPYAQAVPAYAPAAYAAPALAAPALGSHIAYGYTGLAQTLL